MEVCLKEHPPLFKISDTQYASCWLHSVESPVVEGYIKTKKILKDEED